MTTAEVPWDFVVRDHFEWRIKTFQNYQELNIDGKVRDSVYRTSAGTVVTKFIPP